MPEEPEAVVGRRVVIDVGPVHSERALHAVLKRELDFPAFYGMNWGAFWDAITGLVEMPDCLCFVHWAELELRVPSAAAELRRQLARYRSVAHSLDVVYDP